MGVHEYGNEEIQAEVDKLKDDGVTVYSISRINSFKTCQYGYYNTYVKRNRGLDSVYSGAGTFCHEYLEKVYRGEIEDTSDFKRKLNTALFKLEMNGLTFPNESIEKSWRKDMEHFCDNFKKLDGEFELEKAYLAKFDDYYMYGYIDVIRETEDGNIEIHDFKTSSKFGSKDKLKHAGRQLIVYKLALEQKDMKIDKVMWNMLKYCYICWKQKNGKIKQKMVNRGKIIKEMRKNFEKTMLASGMDEITVVMTLDEAEKKNDFDMLPQVIKDTYAIEDCLLEYNVTEDIIDETTNYVVNTIKEIESMDFNNEDEWTPLDIDKDNFFCNTLCGFRDSCKFLKQWKKDNPFKKIGF